MTPDAMHELAVLMRAGSATLDERDTLMNAADEVDELDELEGQPAAVVSSLRHRVASQTDAGGGGESGLTASARVLYGAHAFELYGVPRQPLVSLYGIGGHDACDPLAFCRNPLHPGPCKGWKHTLKAVAPGVHAQIEADRLDRVNRRREERRQLARDRGLPEPKFRKLKHERGDSEGSGDPVDRKGQGKGRDADKDGKYNEGEYVRKGRKKAGPDGAPAEQRAVKVNPDTHKAVTAAVKLLPKGRDEWAAQLREPYQEVTWDRLNTVNQLQLDDANRNLRASQAMWLRTASASYRRKNPNAAPIDNWDDLKAKLPDMAQEWEDHEGKPLRAAVADAKSRADYTQQILDDAERQIAALGGRKADGSVPDGFVLPRGVNSVEDFKAKTKYRPRNDHDRDATGARVPDATLVKQHAAVQKAGELIHRDIKAAIDSDPESQRLRTEHAAAVNARYDHSRPGSERVAAGKRATELMTARKVRERELVMDALSQFREMGTARHGGDGVVPITSRNDLYMLAGNSSGWELARPDWEAQLEESDRHFPTDWVRMSSAGSKMEIISTDRAFHRGTPTNWLPEYGGSPGPTTLAMNTDAGASGAAYRGAFPSYVHEVTYHEMGHRMESQIPGLAALEYAYVRSRTTHGGVVEGKVKLKDVYGGAYADYEVAYKDKFPNLYTGKTYESDYTDPALTNWEAFQVGIQQTIGRNDNKYGDDSLEHFVLGVMATLGRE